MDKETAKDKIKQLVKDFSENPKYWDSKPEEDIKFQFIEPLFEALGWERKEISKESRILKGRADYILKNGNQEVLVIEAKKTNVPLTEEEGKQAVSYAYHRKIKFSVLTNFKHLRVYHALSNIKNIDKNLLRVNKDYFRLEFKEFIEKFDILWLLSKESFEKGEINKLLSSKDEKINKPIDENILNDLLNIRGWLSKELKAKKNYLEKETIDEIIQILIDRLIFIRSVEDRGLEPMNYLRSFESDVRQQRTNLQLYPYLLQKFEEFNEKYDSKLFEKGLLEKEGNFSDDVLRKVILTLYFGSDNNQDRYLFDQIPGDLFGSIYEQYLGTILAGTEKRVTLDSSSGKRKKMGIYYTPAYIVDYIVKNTVREYIKNKTIDEILEVNILDPACGSGSFITRAFVEVCNVIEDKLNNGEEGSKSLFKNSGKKIDKLNLGQKIEILRNCIYGVDLDEKAVELARLNLLLKLLDEETQETRKMLLPHLENNIKCGNSLIDDSKVSDRAFNWNAQFPDVFKNGGFDVVVGNPPWGAEFSSEELNFFVKKYEISKKNINTFDLFVRKAINILKELGKFGFVIPKNSIKSNDYTSLRKYILEKTRIKNLDVFGIFEGVTQEFITLIFEKSGENIDKKNKNIITINSKTKINQDKFYKNTNFIFNPELNDFEDIFNKVEIGDELGKIIFVKRGEEISKKGEVFQCPLCKKWFPASKQLEKKCEHCAKVLQLTKCKKYNLVSELKDKEHQIPIFTGEDVLPYFVLNTKYFDSSKEGIKYKEKEMYHGERLLMNKIASTFKVGIVNEEGYSTQNVYTIKLSIPKKDEIKILLGLFNSKLWKFYYEKKFNLGAKITTAISLENVRKLSFPRISEKVQQKIISLVNQMLELQKKYHEDKTAGNEKERLKQQIKNVDYEINQEVYKLYGITPEEQKIIEEGLK